MLKQSFRQKRFLNPKKPFKENNEPSIIHFLSARLAILQGRFLRLHPVRRDARRKNQLIRTRRIQQTSIVCYV
jgi:hypothetical protein